MRRSLSSVSECVSKMSSIVTCTSPREHFLHPVVRSLREHLADANLLDSLGCDPQGAAEKQ
jgi:hypothetical protein